MKYNQIILLKFIVSSFIIAASPSETIKKPKLENNIKIKYPKTMQSSKVEGKSIAEFIVDEDGSTSQISIVESLGPAFDYEMISAIKIGMPVFYSLVKREVTCFGLIHGN